MPKIKLASPTSFPLGGAEEVYITRSKTTPNVYHLTVVLETPLAIKGFGAQDFDIICTCKGFVNHKKCWHIEHAAGTRAAKEQDDGS